MLRSFYFIRHLRQCMVCILDMAVHADRPTEFHPIGSTLETLNPI